MWLANQFPGRFDIIWGNSLLEVPKFHQLNPGLKSELLFIDGGHSYDIAKMDLKNFAKLANPAYNRVLMDDTFLHELKDAWCEMVHAGELRQLRSYSGRISDGRSV